MKITDGKFRPATKKLSSLLVHIISFKRYTDSSLPGFRGNFGQS